MLTEYLSRVAAGGNVFNAMSPTTPKPRALSEPWMAAMASRPRYSQPNRIDHDQPRAKAIPPREGYGCDADKPTTGPRLTRGQSCQKGCG